MLYHFSENDSITRFVPLEKQNVAGMPPVVWAIDEEHESAYYFPRDCPRIVLRRSELNSEKNRLLFFNYTTAGTIITVENGWYTKIQEQKLYRYCFNEDDFELFDLTAGYYISHQPVEPVRVEAVSNLVERLLDRDIELRFTANLHPLREAILASDFAGFSIIRFKNAKQG